MEERKFITGEYVKSIIKPRPEDSQKGDNGKVLLITGAEGMAGAAVMTGRAAVRAGAGLTTYFIPYELLTILQTRVPEAMCLIRGKNEADLNKYDAIAMGPGIGDRPDNAALLDRILSEYEGTLILDADGLNTLARTWGAGTLKSASCRTVITPHMGEAARLLDDDISSLVTERKNTALRLAEQTGAVVVLKGAGTLVAEKTDAGGGSRAAAGAADQDAGSSGIREDAGEDHAGIRMLKNTTGTPGMAKGGSGDTLTGIITALAAQGLAPFEAAAAGVYVHGYAGELAEEKFGQYGMTGIDMAELTGNAMKEITGR